MVHDHFIHVRGSSLHYAKVGRGPETLLVFHGFGQDRSAFENIARSLSDQYTLYIFDLYFHGTSTWAHGETPLGKAEWSETMRIFLEQNAITQFALAGFSLGGKFVLATLEAFPDKVNRIFLIAPDGIKTSFWYSLATWPISFRRFFKSMIRNPGRFLHLAALLHRAKLVDAGLIRFAQYQMATEEKRRRVYYSWVVFRHLKFDLRHIARLINEKRIPVTMIAGRYDKVIMPRNLKAFLSRLHACRFEIVNSGHNGLIDASLPYFVSND